VYVYVLPYSFVRWKFNVRPTRGEPIAIIIMHSRNWSKNRAFFFFDLCSCSGSSLAVVERRLDVENAGSLSRRREPAETSSGPSPPNHISETSFTARNSHGRTEQTVDDERAPKYGLFTFCQPTRPGVRLDRSSCRMAAAADDPNNDGRYCWGQCSSRGSHYGFGFMSSLRKRTTLPPFQNVYRAGISRLAAAAGNGFNHFVACNPSRPTNRLRRKRFNYNRGRESDGFGG